MVSSCRKRMLGCSLWGRLNLNRTAGRSCTTVSGREVGHALLIRVESKPAYAEESMDLARQLPSLSEVQQELRMLSKDIQAFYLRRPDVQGTDKLLRSMKGKIAMGSTNFVASSQKDHGTDIGQNKIAQNFEGDELLKQIQGAVNNIRGIRAELQAADLFPDVIAVCHKFYSKPEGGTVYSEEAHPDRVLGCGKRRGLGVEVDVVAQAGAWWVEVKSHEAFGLSSTHWTGYRGHTKGLKEQAEERLAVAQCPCNVVRGQRPSVIFFFPEGVDSLVEGELKEMGAFVVDGRLEITPQLPPPPTPLQFVNLDVTTLCVLVSEVSNGGALGGGTPEVLAWASRISHWIESVEAETADPILPKLHGVFQGRQLIASCNAVEHFEKLLSSCGGPREHKRWQDIKATLVIVEPPHVDGIHVEPQPSRKAAVRDRDECDGEELCPGMCLAGWPLAQPQRFFSNRVARLEHVTAAQKWVLGLSDVSRALTVTANGKLMKAASKQGVHLESFVHRAMWLAGF